MAADYPYALATGRIKTLFDKIHSTGVPPKANDTWLKQIGLSSSNDRRLKGVLRFIGFTDASGTPTPLWRAYRGRDGAIQLAESIRKSYGELYQMYPDAHVRPDDDLASIVRASTGLGSEATRAIVATFKSLSALAEFGGTESTDDQGRSGAVDQSRSMTDSKEPERRTKMNHELGSAASVIVNVNLQLTLPESKDPDVYDALFGSLAKHLLPGK